MGISAAVFAHLSAFGALTALVPSARITPLFREQDSALPAITYQEVGNAPVVSWGGALADRPRVQVSVWADDVVGGEAIAAQVEAAMATFEGSLGGETIRGADPLGRSAVLNTDSEGNKGVILIALDFEVFAE